MAGGETCNLVRTTYDGLRVALLLLDLASGFHTLVDIVTLWVLWKSVVGGGKDNCGEGGSPSLREIKKGDLSRIPCRSRIRV